MAAPEISVIVPIYRVEPYIRQCLESIAAQTFESLEVICVDDCGGDRSIDIAEEFAARDTRFTVIRHEKNVGQGGARNTGMDIARGRYVAFLDSDDWILPKKYEREYQEIEKTGLPSVWSKFFLSYTNGDLNKARFRNEAGRPLGLEIDLETNWIANHYPAVWNKLFRAECLRGKNGIRFLEHVKYEDVDFTFRFYCLYPQACIVDEYLHMYRQRSDSTMGVTLSGGDRCVDFLAIYRNCYEFLNARGLWKEKAAQFTRLMARISEPYLRLRNCRESMISVLQQICVEIGYPAEFTDDRIPTLDSALNWQKGKIPPLAAQVLYPLNKLNPLSTLRRKWRKTLGLYR